MPGNIDPYGAEHALGKHEFPGCNSSVVSQLSTPTARSPYLEYGLSITVTTQNSAFTLSAHRSLEISNSSNPELAQSL